MLKMIQNRMSKLDYNFYHRQHWIPFGLMLIVIGVTADQETGVETGAVMATAAVASPLSSLDYDAFDAISSELYDLDTEQSQARYDPRLLSKELLSSAAATSSKQLHADGGSLLDVDVTATTDDDAADANEQNGEGAYCVNSNKRYEHGEKIQRSDPCEICLCVDGEVFCWWKKCMENTVKKLNPKKQKHSKSQQQKFGHHHNHHHGHGKQKHHHNRNHRPTNSNEANEKFQKEETQTMSHHQHQQPPQLMDQQKSHQKTISKKFDTSKTKIPTNVLTFRQHLPVHIMDLDVNEMDADDIDSNQQQSTPLSFAALTNNDQQTLAQLSTTTVFAPAAIRIPENVLSSNLPIIRSDDATEIKGDNGNGEHRINNVVLNDKVTSISVIERDENAWKLFSGNGDHNNATKPVILVDNNSKLLSTMENLNGHRGGVGDANNNGDSSSRSLSDDSDDSAAIANEKGYYEKTIINKNGVFIENIRKITNIDQRILGSMDNDDNGNDPDTNTDDMASSSMQLKQKMINNDKDLVNTYNDGVVANANSDSKSGPNASTLTNAAMESTANGKINRKTIELMNNVPVAHSLQHYVITSSGKIEKTDTLASDDIIAQFQGGLNTNNNNNVNLNNNNNNSNYYQTSNVLSSINSNSNNNKTNAAAQAQEQNGLSRNTNAASIASAAVATTTTNFAARPHIVDVLMASGTLLTTINSAIPASVTTSTLSDQSNSNCIVMGKSYKIGTVLPQETGNCLQCVCVKGANEGDPPRVTCSPHNCPPLILPDLFDSTGY